MVIADAYSPLIDTTFESFLISKQCLVLHFGKTISGKQVDISLSSDADICFAKEDIFTPYNEFDLLNPEHLRSLYLAISKKVKAFAPLGKDRACRMDLGDISLFFWAAPKGPLGHLFSAVQKTDFVETSHWVADR